MEGGTEPHVAKLNRLKTLWQKGKCTLGTIATIRSVQTVQVMARSGLDWIIIDMEHGRIDLAAAHAMIAATSGTPVGSFRSSARRCALACESSTRLGRIGRVLSDDHATR